MIKKNALFLLLTLVILLILFLFFKEFIPPNNAPKERGVWATIDAYPPDLVIVSPVSADYSNNEIKIKHSVSDSASGIDIVWYNLDGGQNITLTGDADIIVSKGGHTLYFYAKDVAGLVNGSESVTFSVK